MVEALKKLDKKFLIMFGCIILLPILLIIFLAIIQGCSNRKITYEKYESKMISAAEKYIKVKDKIPTEEAQTVTIKLNKLVSDGYIKSTEKLLDDESCKGSVTVRRNGSSIDSNNGGFLNYTVSLECKKHSTTTLNKKLIKNVVTEGSGLYKTEKGYIFKGDKAKNNITFYGKNYKIMSIDENGIIKLVKTEPELSSRIWDNKYNIQTNHYSGQNIYKDSKILNFLLNDYNNSKVIKKSARRHIVAYDSCIGKRNMNDYHISNELDCSEKLNKQVISLLNVSDYAMASLDVNCTDLLSKSCNNYNYLYTLMSSSWTLNSSSDDTYHVATITNGRIEYLEANTYSEYTIVIYIDGNELYQSGKGTSENPYVIE